MLNMNNSLVKREDNLKRVQVHLKGPYHKQEMWNRKSKSIN